MMPSAAKQQQTVVKNGTTTTTTTVTTDQSNLGNTKFTQAELGTRSFARTVEKNIAEMNKKKSEIGTNPLLEIEPHSVSHIPDDLNFSSTSDKDQLPQTVIDILAFHGVSFVEGDRIVHIPGAKYFSISKTENGTTTYRSFLLDEDITPSEPEPEEEEGVPETTDSIVSETVESPTITTTGNVPVSQDSVSSTTSGSGINTLGTIGVSQPAETPISQPSVPENFMSPFAVGDSTSVNQLESSQKTVSVPVTENPVVVQNVTSTVSQEPVPSNNPKSEPVTLSSQKNLDKARIASNRERDAYYANRYINSINGTITELFGTNPLIHSELFKTVQDYEMVRKSVLQEMGTQKKSFHEVVSWVKQEQIEIAHLFSHEKSQLFMKLAKLLNLSVPSVIETRTGAGPIVSHSSNSALSQKLGFTSTVSTTPSWNYLFAMERPVKRDFTKNTTILTPKTSPEVVVTSPTVEHSQMIQPESLVSVPVLEVIPERKVDKKQLFTKLHTIIAKAWDISLPGTNQPTTNTESVEVVSQPAQEKVNESFELDIQQSTPETIPTEEINETIPDHVMTALSFTPTPVPESPAVANMSSPMKQHPEELFS